MSSLHEFQRQLAASLLPIESAANDEPTPPAQTHMSGLHVHRQTVSSALTSALQYAYPSVLRLLGGAEFARLAACYARHHPPQTAVPGEYGARFPEYLVLWAGSTESWLIDVARFDREVEQVAKEPLGLFGNPIALGRTTSLRLDASLRCQRFSYPVDLLQGAQAPSISDGSSRGPDAFPAPRHLAIWRNAEGAAVKWLSEPSVRFLKSLLASHGPKEAILVAVGRLDPQKVVKAVRSELFSSSFCLITSCLHRAMTAQQIPRFTTPPAHA